jgi:NitT/TauT family transport system substrate-binding protein
VIRVRLPVAALLGVLLVGACTGGSGATAPSASTPGAPAGSAAASVDPSASPSGAGTVEPSVAPVALKVGLGYIPSVQFAPFYLAQQAGYYRDAGLEVEFQNRIDPDLITLVGQGAIDVGLADGTSVIPAVSQGIPVRYIATVYGKFPSIVFAKESSGITDAADLKGRKIGTPGRYGSSWVMLQALLGSAGLTPDDVQIVEYPDFGQGAAVSQGAVDAATGFANNEPVQLERSGEKAVVLRVDDITPLQGPGIIAGTTTLESKGDAVAGFVAATLRAMEEITQTPERGLEAAVVAVPELASDRAGQAAILDATIDSWQGPLTATRGLGAIDRDGWTKSIEYMTSLGLVPQPVTVDDVIREGLLPSGE